MARKSKTRPQSAGKTSQEILQPARLDGDKLKLLYATMMRRRLLAEKLNELAEQGRLDPSAYIEACNDAVETGLLVDLRAEDLVAAGGSFATVRLARGQSVKSIIIGLVRGQAPSSSRKADPRQESTIPSEFTIAAQINLAIGAAWARKTQGSGHVAIVLCREVSIPFPEWLDALSFSIRHRLAVVHVVQTVRREKVVAAGNPFESQWEGLSSRLPTLLVDGDDALAVYRVGQEAVRRARQGRGPALIECQTANVPASGSPTLHAPLLLNDPLARLEAYLREKGFWSDRWQRGLLSSFRHELDRAGEVIEQSRPRLLPADTDPRCVLASVG